MIAACATTPKPAPRRTPDPELSPALVPLASWLGAHALPDGVEAWTAAGGALFGIALHRDGSFDAMVVDDAPGPGPADGVLRFYAMPRGAAAPDATTIDAHRAIVATLAPATLARAPELEAADRAFAADTHARGADGWLAAFAPDGAMVNKKRVEHDQVRDAIAPLLASGDLAWAPIASGKLGDVGFTVGKATFAPTNHDPNDAWRSSYLTVWHRTEAGWRVWFDTGRIVNP